MTQVNQAPPARPGAAAPAPAAPAGATKPVDTPALLSRWNLVSVVTVVVFGLLSAFIQFLSWQSDDRAADETSQLVRVQVIKSELLRADALAANGYLAAGLESADRKHEYDATIADVLRQIADAAEAQPADRDALAALNQQVEAYTTNVAQAAVYNRQGVPLGIAYQTTASNQLRDQAIKIADALIDANTQRSKDAIGGQHPLYLLLVGVAALAVLFLVNRQMAQMFRRRFNSGLAIAGIIVLVTTLVTVVAAFLGARSNAHTEDHAYADATAAATARSSANEAKADESLRLINRGSGTKYEDPWQAARKVVDASAPAADKGVWDTYVQRHQEIVRLDDTNQWKTAVTKATTAARSGSTYAFDRFDTLMRQLATDSGAQATDDLRSGRTIALLLSLLTALLGLVAAVAVSRGIDQRQKEFL
jgi:amino acid transporter